jgi:hypothetical protein
LHEQMLGISHHRDPILLSLILYSSVKHYIFINHRGTTPVYESGYTLLEKAASHHI